MPYEALFLAGSGSSPSQVRFNEGAARACSFPFDRSNCFGSRGERPTGVRAGTEELAVSTDEVAAATEMAVWSVARAEFTADRCMAAIRANISALWGSAKLNGISVEGKENKIMSANEDIK